MDIKKVIEGQIVILEKFNDEMVIKHGIGALEDIRDNAHTINCLINTLHGLEDSSRVRSGKTSEE